MNSPCSFFALTGIFAVVGGLILFAVFRFRASGSNSPDEPAQLYGSTQIELAWTVAPVLIVIVLFVTTARFIFKIQDAPKSPSALDVIVTGHQFWWEFRYPQLGIVTANELHIPLSTDESPRPTYLKLLSADVNHSFWIPQLGGKTDLIPNHPNSMWMDPKRAGVYLGQCAQFCGLQHAMVLLRVSVDTREDFAAWVLNQQQPGVQDAKVAAGRHVFETQACINCHSINGTSGTVAWLSMNLAYLGWHIPRAYEFALKSESCHNLEHLCFLATSIQFWWVVIASSPYRRSVISAWVLVPYLLVADIVNRSFCFAVLFRAAALSQLRTNYAPIRTRCSEGSSRRRGVHVGVRFGRLSCSGDRHSDASLFRRDDAVGRFQA